jgi:Permuted papain-like amidase enzyme, YaeF/YiiX, C92 family
MRGRARIVRFAAILALALVLGTDALQGVGAAEAERERAFADAIATTAQPGDLLFISAGGTWSDLARFLSRREQLYSHVGVIARVAGQLVVIHAGGNPLHSEAGVHADSILFFMATVTRIGLYRLPERLRGPFLSYVETAKARHLPFDSEFSLKTADRLYCTELIWRGLVQTMRRDPIPEKTWAMGEDYVALDDVTRLPFLTKVPVTIPDVPLAR